MSAGTPRGIRGAIATTLGLLRRNLMPRLGLGSRGLRLGRDCRLDFRSRLRCPDAGSLVLDDRCWIERASISVEEGAEFAAGAGARLEDAVVFVGRGSKVVLAEGARLHNVRVEALRGARLELEAGAQLHGSARQSHVVAHEGSARFAPNTNIQGDIFVRFG